MSTLRVYFLDVGQGDCTLICLPDNTAIVVDCAKELTLLEILGDKQIKHIRALIATHLDKDHIEGLNRVLKLYESCRAEPSSTTPQLDIESLWLAPDRARSSLPWEAHELLSFASRRARKLGIHVRSTSRDGGDPPKLIWRSDNEQEQICVELLLPFFDQHVDMYERARKEGNPVSGVIRVRHGQRTVLIGGDAILGSFELLCDIGERELRADVIRSPHHAGDIVALCKNWKSPADLYSQTRSNIIVHSVGTGNAYGHPAAEHIRASTNGGACHVMCTQLTSQCHANLGDDRLRTHGFFDVAYPYHRLAGFRHEDSKPKNVPCAGTVLVVLDEDQLRTFPTTAEHRGFVDTLDHPLCR
jgi:beta-lactamase superfamily II metal-dependent hydrolase